MQIFRERSALKRWPKSIRRKKMDEKIKDLNLLLLYFCGWEGELAPKPGIEANRAAAKALCH